MGIDMMFCGLNGPPYNLKNFLDLPYSIVRLKKNDLSRNGEQYIFLSTHSLWIIMLAEHYRYSRQVV